MVAESVCVYVAPHVVQISPQMLEMWMDGWNGCLLGISCDTDYCDGWVGRLEVDLLESVAWKSWVPRFRGERAGES